MKINIELRSAEGGGFGMELHEYLGMTIEEYELWLTKCILPKWLY